MQTAPRGGAERAARPDSFLWGAGHGGAVRPQAERGSLGDGDNGFHLKGRSEPEQRTAGGPAPGAGSGGWGLGPGRGGLGGRRASGRKAAGGVVWAAGPGAAGGWRGGGEGDRAIAASEQPAAAQVKGWKAAAGFPERLA